MSKTQTALEAYGQHDRPLKYHEVDMLNIIKSHIDRNETGNILDLGCADGLFLEALRAPFQNARLLGVELDASLTKRGNKRFSNDPNASIMQENVIKFTHSERFKVIIASGIMTIFDEPYEFLDRYVDMLEENGVMVIFGRFNSFPINSKFLVKQVGEKEWAEPRVSYYTGEITDYLQPKGFKTEFVKFDLPIDLPKKNNPFASYTVRSKNEGNIILCGANVVIECHFLTITKE